ncbi:MAG: hypothetical protein IT581_08695 [Verrucomicrobiales bacterium]|nr:hypothetical protein [Verrucomicrobiales bacterium]
MAILGYKGDLPVAVSFQWKGDIVAGVVDASLKDNLYVLANELVTEFEIVADLGSWEMLISRKATPKKRFFDSTLNFYVSSPISSDDLEDLLDPANKATFKVNLTFTYRTFFDVLLTQMTRLDSTSHNPANPKDTKPILDTFTHGRSGKKVRITYKEESKTLKGLSCSLRNHDIKAAKSGKVPGVKLIFQLDFGSSPGAAEKEAMRKLVAMDWSSLARRGRAKSPDPVVLIWQENVSLYLINHTDLSRGERLRQEIQDRHVGKTPKALSTDLRVDIDRHLVTANHWGEDRESRKSEHYQWVLSELLGTLHQSAWRSSPVLHSRTISQLFSLTTQQKAALALQYGVGHCGEHADVSFSILMGIIDSPGNLVSGVVSSGNANVDHAFVVYNMEVNDVIKTKATSPANSRVKVDEELHLFDLRKALAAAAKREAFVMDPYLDASVMKSTAKELLAAINGPGKKKRKKDTDFLAYVDQYPIPLGFNIDDITSKTSAERAAKVKNV